MAENKNQHFVPVFYLKNFSTVEDSSRTNVLILDPKKAIINTPIKNQAQSDYFYGRDLTVERYLSQIEGDAKYIIDSLNQEFYDHHYDNELRKTVLYLTFLQYIRTRKSRDSVNESLEKMVQHFYSLNPKLESKEHGSIFFSEEHLAEIIKSIPERMFMVDDLEFKLIKNNSRIDFITSDHPVIKYNRFLRGKNKPGSHIGWPMKGLQVFFPISPRRMIMLYDKITYKIGDRKSRTIEVDSNDDIESLNKLQLINADKVIFFRNNFDEKPLLSSLANIKRKQDHSKLYKAKTINRGESSSQVIMVSNEDIDYDLNVNFIKYTKKAKQYRMSDFLIEFRSEKLKQEFVNRKIYKTANLRYTS